MVKNKHYNIAMVLYTSGLDYDDRIRKEILSIKEMYSNIDFKIFAVEPINREEVGITSYGIPYRIPYLKTRYKYASGTHKFLKVWDFYNSIKKDLSKFDAIWCADPETFLFVLMIQSKPIVWDLHELPLAFMKNPLMKILFRFLESKCKVMIHANNARLQYLYSEGLIKHLSRQFYLRNYPQFDEFDTEYDETYNKFVKWKGDDKCVYLQGIGSAERADIESIEAVLSIDGLKAVVIGKIQPNRRKIITDKFGEEVLKKRVFFTGQIKQLKTPQYIKQCFTSLVFYKNSSPNNWFCEPNRMFQTTIYGKPIIVGNNPPMKEYIENNAIGVCIDTDGSDVMKIIKGLECIITNYEYYKTNIYNSTKKILWHSQNRIIQKIIDKLLE